MSNILNGAEPKFSTICKILKAEPNISTDWLISGKGGMYIEGNQKEEDISDLSVVSSYIREELIDLPLVEQDAAASFVENLPDWDKRQNDTFAVMPESGEALDSSYIVFKVNGQSMEPTIPDKAKILSKLIPEEEWESASGVVAVVYNKSLIIKRVHKNALFSKNVITLSADNPQTVPTLDIERSEIRAMWKVVRIVSSEVR